MRRGHPSQSWLAIVRSLAIALLTLVGFLPSAAQSATRSWVNPAGGNWNSPTNWDTGVPGPADAAIITLSGTYAVTLDVNPTVASLTLGGTSGTQTLTASSRTLSLNGASTVSANGRVNLASSTIGGTGSLTSGGVLTLAASTINVPLVNNGSTTITGATASSVNGTYTSGPGSSLQVASTPSGITTLTIAAGFTNNGTITLTPTGVFAGVLNVTTGTLVNASGRSIISAGGVLGAQLDNQGTVSATGNLNLSKLSADHVNTGTINVSGGTMTVAQTGVTPSFANSGAITIAAARTLAVSGGSLVYNSGSTLSGGTVSLISGASASLNTDLTGANFQVLGGTVNGPASLVVGTGRTLTGDVATINSPLVNNGSTTITGASASSVNGTYTSGPGSSLQVASTPSGITTLTIAAGFTNNGTITLTPTGVFAGVLNVTTGTLVNASGRSIISAGGVLGAQLDNQGTVSATGNLNLSKPSADHVNTGTINVSGGTMTVAQTGVTPSFANSGAITIAAARTLAVSGGSLVYNSGSTLSGGTVSLISGASASLNTDLTGANFQVLGGTVNGPASLVVGTGRTLTGDAATLNSPLVNNGSTTITGASASSVNGTYTSGPGSSLQVASTPSGITTLTIAAGFINNGTITLTPTGVFAGVLNVTTGTLLNAAGGTITSAGGVLGAQLDNQGTVSATGNLTLAKSSVDHVSSGAINVISGNMTIAQTGTTPTFVNSGVITINGGRTLLSTTGVFTNAAAGVIRGTGNLNIGNTFTNHGTMAPGSETTAGILTVTGIYRQAATGLLAINLGGLAPGAQHDRLAVNGTVMLAGTIGADLISGFVPISGDVFFVMTHSAGTGTTFDGFANGTGLCFEPHYSATAVSLDACACVPPTIASGPVSTAVCAGHHSAMFAVVADGTAPLAYQWRKDGIDIAGANDASFSIALATFSDAGDYDVVVANDCGEEVSEAAVLTILPEGPDIEEQPVDSAACVGSDVIFTVVAEAHMGGALSYQWRKDGTPIAGATSTTLLVQVDGLDDGGQYDCEVTETGCGSTTSHPAVLAVKNEAPVITLNGEPEVILECHSVYHEQEALVIDDCDGGLSAVIAGDVVDTSRIGSYAVIYLATDSQGNAADQVVRVVRVQDTLAPQITLNGDPMVTVECHAAFADPGAVAIDSCDPDVEVLVDGTVDQDTPGDYVITYSATDGAGNPAEPISRTFEVRDTVAPIIALVGESTVNVECSGSYHELGATVTDACDASVEIVIAGDPVNTNTPGDYLVTYDATDDAGNETQVSRTVHVEDTTPPILSVSSTPIVVVDLNCSGSETVTVPQASASDLCDAAPSVTHDAPPAFAPGTTVVTYRAVDDAGNETTQTLSVQVQHGAAVTVLAASQTVGAGTRPSTTKAPLAETLVRAYSRGAGSCAVQIGGPAPNWQHYPEIVDACTPVNTATTDANGIAIMDLPPGNYILIATSDVESETVYIGDHLNNLACGDAVTKKMQLIVANGTPRPGKTTRLTGSELLIIEPEYVIWDDSTQAYPFVFESVGDWSVTASVAPPDGFVADFPQLAAQVQSELEAVQFLITEVGSDLVPTRTTFKVTHGRRQHTVRSDVGIMLTTAYARSRGFDVAELRGRGLLVEERGGLRGRTVDGESALIAHDEAPSTVPAGVNSPKEEAGLGGAALQAGPVGLHVWPSPFNGTGSMHLALALANGEVPYDLDLGLFDVTGRQVLTIPTDLSVGRDGVGHIVWDGGEVRRGQIAPGVYFLRASAPSIGMLIQRKLVVMR